MDAGSYSRQSRDSTKSIDDQANDNRAAAAAEGWQVVAEYADGTSASRFAKRVRDSWQQVLADIDRRAFDVLILWESSRGDRTPETWFAFLSLCRARGVLIHVTSHERTYDMRKRRDWRTLAEEGIDSADESEKISLRVLRGLASSAADGRPWGRCPEGYRRVYDPQTGKLAGQEIDPDRAPIIREIIERVARNEPILSIVNDLNAAGIRPVRAARWYPARIRDIAVNPAYRAVRVHNDAEYPAVWPAIVDDVTWFAAQRVLSDPRRRMTRPGRQVHLLSYLATCGVCEEQRAGEGLPPSPMNATYSMYRCQFNGCVGIVRHRVDDHVRDVVIGVLSRPDWHDALRQAGDDADREVVEAREAAARLRAELDGWRRSAARGETTPESLAVVESGLSARIRAADQRARVAGVPPSVLAMLTPGDDVRERWEAATVPARREVIRTLCTVRIFRSTTAGRAPFDATRVDIKPR